jgi:IrrE N-terminal-like domain
MKRGVLTTLRDVVPLRPLSPNEAYRIAELQVDRLLKLADLTKPPVPVERLVAEVPKVHVRYTRPFPISGCTEWIGSAWSITISAAEPKTRQRFTLAHEFKHVLDNRFIDILYPDYFGMTSHERAEAVCNYFAGCLLVPKVWLKQAWVSGIQSPIALAKLFNVSTVAIEVRLSQTGLNREFDRADWPRTTSRTGRYFRLGNVATACEVAA